MLSGRSAAGVEPAAQAGALRAGAAAVDVSPETFPVLVNGGFLQAVATRVNDPLFARALVLDDGTTRLAIVVVDSCMVPRELLDRAKELAREKTGIATERMLVSATHTHTAPAAMGALGCPADPAYVKLLPGRIAEAVTRAAANLTAARAGWGVIDDDRHTFCRRWIRRPDRMIDDPFGQKTVRAHMHPGYVNPDVIAPSGPVDPALTVLSIQTAEGRPLAVLANYSQHYFGSTPVSADYYGRFSRALARRLGAGAGSPAFVGIMSQGTSGDQMWMDYGSPRNDPGLDRYSEEVAESAFKAYQSITAYHDRVPLAMAETTLTLRRRTPDAKRLEWARPIVAAMGQRVPRNQPEVYAKEVFFLHEDPERTLKIQAIRVGELGITAIPNEVYALTGLKLKARSPFPLTMNIELANGAEGYIPPPEQHALGGYTTWPARTAGLEVQAEPRIATTALKLLEQVAGRPRRDTSPRPGPYAEHVLASRPLAYWRLEEMEGDTVHDATGREHHGSFDGGYALYLPGADLPGLRAGRRLNRAAHLAGGRLNARLKLPAESYSVELWFWNGLPADARSVTGYLFAQAAGQGEADVLGLTGATGSDAKQPCRLFVAQGSKPAAITGRTEITLRTWHHVVLTRNGRRLAVYLDGDTTPEIAADLDPLPASGATTVHVGGRQDRESTFEGKLDEVSFHDRPLTAAEIAEHHRAAADQRGDANRR